MYVNFTGWITRVIVDTVYVLNPKSHVKEPQIEVFEGNVWFIVNEPEVPDKMPFEVQSSFKVVDEDLMHEPDVRVDPEGQLVQALDAEEVQVWQEKLHLLQVTPAG